MIPTMPLRIPIVRLLNASNIREVYIESCFVTLSVTGFLKFELNASHNYVRRNRDVPDRACIVYIYIRLLFPGPAGTR